MAALVICKPLARMIPWLEYNSRHRATAGDHLQHQRTASTDRVSGERRLQLCPSATCTVTVNPQ
jgi:hypothetical protein